MGRSECINWPTQMVSPNTCIHICTHMPIYIYKEGKKKGRKKPV